MSVTDETILTGRRKFLGLFGGFAEAVFDRKGELAP
jgi:hypothetical protein